MGCFSFTDYIINKQNLLSNIKIIRSKLRDDVKLCAVVKANAYGVGSGLIAEMLSDCVDCFAVASLTEGIALREKGIDKNILTLGTTNLEQIWYYEKYFLSPTVSSVGEMSKLSSDVKNPIQVEFGLNTGMNRIGFSEKSDILQSIALKNLNKKISIFGVFSHLATKENDIKFMYRQKEKFDEFLELFHGERIVRHLSNTNACLNHKDFNYDMVRVGFGLYGMSDNDDGLLPVISIRSRVVKINFINKGESVGYDRTFVAEHDMKIVVVPIGYYDGISRAISNVGKVIINGEYANVIGRVCMDMLMADATGIDCVEVGSSVVLLGTDGNKKVTTSNYAKWCNTSDYEVLARINNSRMNIVIK